MLWTLHPTPELAWTLASRMTRSSPVPITRQDVERAFRACGGNLRETWFALYDVVTRRRTE